MGEGDMPSAWRKSSLSQSGDCAEWARSGMHMYMRNSKDATGPVLRFTLAEWRAFIDGVKAGEADLATD